MKIYTRVVIDMRSGLVVEELYEMYSGPVALCKGPDIPPPPKPPKPPPLPPPPEMEVTEEKKRQEYLDTLLLRMRKAREFKWGPSNSLGLGSTMGAAAAKGLQPKTLLGE